MKFHSDSNWPAALDSIVAGLNQSPSVALGWETPASVQSILDEPRIRQAKKDLAAKLTEKERAKYFPKMDSFQDMILAQKENTSGPQKWSVGDFCYKDETPKKFKKETDEKRGTVYIIDRIITNRTVKRFFLKDLNFRAQLGAVYEQNLRKVPHDALPTSPESYV